MSGLILKDMTVEQKLGMLLCARGYLDDEDKAFILEMIKKRAVGAVQVPFYRENYKDFIAEVKEAADYPILICADMERGYPKGTCKIGCNLELATTGDEKYAYEFARIIAIEAKKEGCNVVWSPVIDVGPNLRRFSDDPEICAKFGAALTKGFQDEGMVCSAKHFPGGKNGRLDPNNLERHVDGHIERKKPDDISEEELMKTAMVPYIRAIEEADLSGIMVGHSTLSAIDPDYPASLSPKVLGLLRKIGFKGVVFTDSMAMMGIASRYSVEESTWRAVAAGADIVLPNYRVKFKEVYDYLVKAYNNGLIPDERIDEAAARVIEAQNKTVKQPESFELTEEQKNLPAEIARKAVVSLCKAGVEAKLSDNTKKLFVIMHENSYPGIVDESKELEGTNAYSKGAALRKKELILKEFPDAEVFLINEFPHNSETEKLCAAMTRADEVAFFTFVNSTSYLASSSLSVRMQYIIKCFTDRITTVVHTGVIKELMRFKDIDRVLYAFPGEESVQLILDALKGRFVPTGKLPIYLGDLGLRQ